MERLTAQRRSALAVLCMEAAGCGKRQSWGHFKAGHGPVKSEACQQALQDAGFVRPGNLMCGDSTRI